jgi:hypothetical protein
VIRPEHQCRFEGDSGVDVASYEIDARLPDGAKILVILRLGAPFQKNDQWWVRAELENLDSTDGPIAGEGSLHTLIMGIRWMILRLAVYEEKVGCTYFWRNTDDLFDYRRVMATEQREDFT